MVFVKTVVYHTLGTLMPYPFEDPPRLPGKLHTLKQLARSCACPFFVPAGREASITSRVKPEDDLKAFSCNSGYGLGRGCGR